jgi:hypothetical protein
VDSVPFSLESVSYNSDNTASDYLPHYRNGAFNSGSSGFYDSFSFSGSFGFSGSSVGEISLKKTSLPGIVRGNLHIDSQSDQFPEETHHDRIRHKRASDAEAHLSAERTDTDLYIGAAMKQLKRSM